MSRFARHQPDLFALQPAICDAPAPDPLAELSDLLGRLRVADSLPWPDAVTTMEVEQRAIALGERAGTEGKRLASAILDETERLFTLAEQA